MIRKIMRSKIRVELHDSDKYYLVDYDFKGAHGQKPHPEYTCFYKKFEETFNQKLARFKSTASVLILHSLEMAQKAAELVKECGGTAYVRECRKIDV